MKLTLLFNLFGATSSRLKINQDYLDYNTRVTVAISLIFSEANSLNFTAAASSTFNEAALLTFC